MPGYHLTDPQVELIRDSLKHRYSFERMAYYKLLCSALKLPPEGFDISNDYFVDSGTFIIKKVEALNEHERLKDIWLAKSRLWEAEHRGMGLISKEDTAYLAEIEAGFQREENIINAITQKFDLLIALQEQINLFSGKTATHHWETTIEEKEPHPLADFSSPNDRLLGPTDTLIG